MMTVLCIAGAVWVGLAFVFVLSLGIAARKPLPHVESAPFALEEAA